jgi:hypothetical protein
LFSVNGQIITKKNYDDRVWQLYSRDLLNKMIWTMIVDQAAEKAGCTPTDAQVNSEISDLSRRHPEVIAKAHLTDPDLSLFRRMIRTSLALKNLRVQKVSVTPDEVKSYYADHQDDFTLPPQFTVIAVVADTKENAEAARRMLEDGVDQSVIAASDGLKVLGYNYHATDGFTDEIRNSIFSLSVGDIAVFPYERKYLLVKVKQKQPAQTPAFNAIRDQVGMAAKLSKAKSDVEELAALRQAADVECLSDQYKAALPLAVDRNAGDDLN